VPPRNFQAVRGTVPVLERGEVSMPIWFYSKVPEYSWLSNLSEHGFELDGERWRSVEHYYQAAKYSDLAIRERIRLADSPARARKLGQDRSLTVRADWEQVKGDVMARAVRAKFEQNTRLRNQLLATGVEELRHESNHDLYWGCTRDGRGKNRLGVILMDLRSGMTRPDGA
jgi:ribA/ribD-fused uncharacterized protein